LKVCIKHNPYQTLFNLVECAFNKEEESFADIYSTTYKQHNFKISTVWTVTTKHAMKTQTVNYLMSSSFM